MKEIMTVIKALRICATEECCDTNECPYEGCSDKYYECYNRLKKDAADLLEAYVSEEDDLK